MLKVVWSVSKTSILCSDSSFVRRGIHFCWHLICMFETMVSWQKSAIYFFYSRSLLNVPSAVVLERWERTCCGAAQWSWKCEFYAITVLFELQLFGFFSVSSMSVYTHVFFESQEIQMNMTRCFYVVWNKNCFKTPQKQKQPKILNKQTKTPTKNQNQQENPRPRINLG